jgi:hypothetical protein
MAMTQESEAALLFSDSAAHKVRELIEARARTAPAPNTGSGRRTGA